jgi:hypothetical protein
MIDEKKIWPCDVTFAVSANYERRFMVRLYDFTAFRFATTCKGSLPKVDYLGFLLAISCGFHFCLASLTP